MQTVGVTIGKFMPLHKGHELMISFGAQMCDRFIVLVSGTNYDEMSLTTRYDWVCRFVEQNNLTNVHVVYHIDRAPIPKNIDDRGTVLDPEYQEYWKNEFNRVVPDATHFISSDMYGKTVANLLGIKWLPVDPNREMVRISGTAIRKDIIRHFDKISDVAKPDYVKKIAVVGPESTGKTTLVKALARKFEMNYANEYGRTLSEVLGNELDATDFDNIVRGQEALINTAVNTSRVTPCIISDTEAFTTYLFSKIYLKSPIENIRERAIIQDFDMYIVFAPTVDWVDDGTRVMPDPNRRREFYNETINFLVTHKKPFVVISGDTFEKREREATLVTYAFLFGGMD